jgi:cleavage stimulation factor subunit 2
MVRAAAKNDVFGRFAACTIMRSICVGFAHQRLCLAVLIVHRSIAAVGNIPYGTTEEQLHMVFSEAGRVTNIRSVIDHETGKPKGYAFVEFEDASDALVAIRNLNGYEVNGRQVSF